MDKSFSESYRAAGVDVTAGYESVRLFKDSVRSTFTKGVLGDLGGFGGFFEPDFTGMARPVTVSGTDGVGTKLKIAFALNRHDTVGIDCVAMCVNDIICSGAAPMFFLDYIACGKNHPEKIAAIVSGIAEGCRQAGCAIIGGETAEHPGMMPEDEYDLAGFTVGLVDYDKIINGKTVKSGDTVIGIASSGIHSNGFSLIRRIFGDSAEVLAELIPELGRTLGDELMIPTKIYVKTILELIKNVDVKGISHMTGGGHYENIPRMLPAGVTARIRRGTWEIPAIFGLIMERGSVPERDMYNTYNMGIGMALAVAPEDAGRTLDILRGRGETAYVIGDVVAGDEGIVFV